MNFATKEDHNLYKLQASLVNFATPYRSSLAFSSLAQEGVGLVQKILCEAAAKDVIHASKLFTSADISSGPRLVELICNFRCVNAGLISNISDSLVIKYLMEYAQSLASPKGKDYCRKFESQPRLFVNMFNDIQTIWRVFLELGMQVDCLQFVRNGQLLPVKLFDPAITTVRTILNGLVTTINRGEMLEYKHIPAAFQFFYPGSKNGDTDSTSANSATSPDLKRLRTEDGNKRGAGPKQVSPDSQNSHRKIDAGRPRGGRAGDSSGRASDSADGKGMLVWKGNLRHMPRCNIMVPNQGSTVPERLCMPFLCRSSHCSNSRCAHPHRSNLCKLPEDKQRELVDWVARTPNLEFATRKGPTGRTPQPAPPAAAQAT